jgi:DNA-binding transcriptional ArsR family regulator
VRSVRVIDDVETLKALADPTRAAIVQLLTEARSVTQLAEALDVPRTRLYHHIELLRAKGLIEQVGERRVGAMTERIYALTARVFRPSVRLLRQGSAEERVEALTTLLFDTTKADLRRSILSGELELDDDSEVPRLGSQVHRRTRSPGRAVRQCARGGRRRATSVRAGLVALSVIAPDSMTIVVEAVLRPATSGDGEHIRWALYTALAWNPKRKLPPPEVTLEHP